MKRIFAVLIALLLMLTMVACADDDTNTEDTSSAKAPETTEDTSANTPETTADTSKNEAEFEAGVYTATSSYASDDGAMNMTWNFVLTLKADGTFTLTDAEGTDKGTGTYAITDDCYTMTYADERIAKFVVQADGTLKMTTDFPYGIATIQLALVGDIVFTYDAELSAKLPADDNGNEDNKGNEDDKGDASETFTLAAGVYEASYEKVSQMAGTVVYKYTATVGSDNSFIYGVKFDMGGQTMEGSSASGTYAIDGNKFTFTPTEGEAIEGTLTADNTLKISLKASAMASEPYEVTFTPEVNTLAVGTYEASYEKVSQMAGTVVYKYTAVVGENGAFSYSVKFDMGGQTMDGSSASGTYKIEGNKLIFTPTEGDAIEGTLTADNTFKISLKASTMATSPYEVTFTPAQTNA